jgi:hypothetical protein
MRILSIDWDYFIESNPSLDYCGAENEFNLNGIWNIRRVHFNFKTRLAEVIDLEKLMPFQGCPAGLVCLAMSFGNYDLHVAESHLGILETIGAADNLEIINVDAHHDIHYGTVPKLKQDITCGNWGSYLLQNGRVKSWTQYYPKWRKKFPEETTPHKYAKERCNFRISFEKPTTRWRKIDVVFVCRSGTFSPPEYDERFTQFCLDLGATEPPLKERPFKIPALVE